MVSNSPFKYHILTQKIKSKFHIIDCANVLKNLHLESEGGLFK
jgi:hypothetical protein